MKKYKVIFGKVRKDGKSYGKDEEIQLDPQDKDTQYLLKNKIVEEITEQEAEKNANGTGAKGDEIDDFKSYVENLTEEQQEEVMNLEENEIKILKAYGEQNREKFWKLSQEQRESFFQETAAKRKEMLKDA